MRQASFFSAWLSLRLCKRLHVEHVLDASCSRSALVHCHSSYLAGVKHANAPSNKLPSSHTNPHAVLLMQNESPSACAKPSNSCNMLWICLALHTWAWQVGAPAAQLLVHCWQQQARPGVSSQACSQRQALAASVQRRMWAVMGCLACPKCLRCSCPSQQVHARSPVSSHLHDPGEGNRTLGLRNMHCTAAAIRQVSKARYWQDRSGKPDWHEKLAARPGQHSTLLGREDDDG